MLWRPRVSPALKGRSEISEPKSNAEANGLPVRRSAEPWQLEAQVSGGGFVRVPEIRRPLTASSSQRWGRTRADDLGAFVCLCDGMWPGNKITGGLPTTRHM